MKLKPQVSPDNKAKILTLNFININMKTFTIFFAKLRYLVSSIFLICTSILTINSFAQTTQTFTSSGSFTVPCNVTSIQVECWGGGGGGAGDIANLATVSGSGGGGGGDSIGT